MGLNLLLVDHDSACAAMLVAELERFGHRVSVAGTGREALIAIDDAPFDAMILDWMPPELDGISVLRRLRENDMTLPVIMLSARGRDVDKIEGLTVGADDYVVKPVTGGELNARLVAILRGRGWSRPAGDTIRAGDIVVSPGRQQAWRNDRPLDLGGIELKLLAEFVRDAGSILTRAMLLERVWRHDGEPATNIVEAHIHRLRGKLTAHGEPDPIVTKRGLGYMLQVTR